ncbi:hypothetical protein SteCoe_16618 [Stentor coeruleus]|uniref:EF-hand domain-containing protein n=1 Tax=Stentor coeruleus TaxID=5963 RepID=A0A1R2C0X5_9CILI|nr:hypothetical protein SteCoe_16618 [Stentor coeruleus]
MEAYSLRPLSFSSHHERSKTAYDTNNLQANLYEIKEESEWGFSENRSIAITPSPSIPKKAYLKKRCRTYTDQPPLSSDPIVADFQKFFTVLQKHLNIYNAFIEKAIENKILKSIELKASDYYYKYIHFTKNPNQLSRTTPFLDSRKSKRDSSVSSNQSENFNVYDKNAKVRLFSILQKNTPIVSMKKDKKKRPNSKKRKAMSSKRVVLNKKKQKLVGIFQSMCGMPNSTLKSCRLTNYLFKCYLQKKFPVEMAEAMSKHFDFKSANFEDFCLEMDRFILSSEERHFALCFDAFDFNKDKYICFQDTYTAIELRKDNIYDSDLIMIQEMFGMKVSGKIPQKKAEPRKGRRMSVMSLSSELSAYEEEMKEKKIPYVHPDKPEALTFDDFQRIEFKTKPQLLCNFFKHICNFDIEKFQEVLTPIIKSRKQSQDIIIERSQSEEPHIIEEYDPKTLYYKELEDAMGLFSIHETADLLKKFEILRDKSSPDFKTISKASMIENWPKLFGAKCDYISERYYKFFAGLKYVDVTKARFLKMIHSLTEDDLRPKIFAFEFYDERADGKITADEIYKFEQSLPVNTLIYEECYVIVNEFLASIFGKKLKPMPFIEFSYFNELIDSSLFYVEFMRVVKTPLDELVKQANTAWTMISL